MFKVWRNVQISTCCHHFCTTKCHFQSDHLPWPVSLRLHDPLKSEIKIGIWSCQNLDLNAKGWCHLDYSQTKNDVINQVVSHNVLWNHLELSHNFVVILYKLDAGNLSVSLSPSLGPRNPPPSPGQLRNLLENLSIWAQEPSPMLESLFLCQKMVVVVVGGWGEGLKHTSQVGPKSESSAGKCQCEFPEHPWLKGGNWSLAFLSTFENQRTNEDYVWLHFQCKKYYLGLFFRQLTSSYIQLQHSHMVWTRTRKCWEKGRRKKKARKKGKKKKKRGGGRGKHANVKLNVRLFCQVWKILFKLSPRNRPCSA